MADSRRSTSKVVAGLGFEHEFRKIIPTAKLSAPTVASFFPTEFDYFDLGSLTNALEEVANSCSLP